jgi:serine/threonine-protein kinase
MALEYLEGRTLGELIRERGALTWPEAVGLARRLAEALAHAHANSVVHRDVKPANVMVLPDGTPKIMDFGIAKIETARLKLTVAGQSVGTPLYMSPEQALGQPADARSDVFSLGTILYTLLTGQLAFAADNVPRIVARVVHDEPPPPSQLVPGLPAALDLVVARAMAKHPAARFQGARELAEDLEDVEQGRPPRHASRPPAADATGQATRVSGAEEDLLLELLEDAAPARPAAVAPAPSLDQLLPPTPPPSRARSASAPRRAWPGRGPLAAGALLLVLVALGLLLASRQPVAVRITPTPGEDERGATTEALPAAPRAPEPAPEEPKAPEASGPAELLLDFEHPLRSGRLKVWIDGELVAEEQLEAHVTRKVAGIRFRSGGLEQTFEVQPGRRTVTVEVAWDDEVRRESLTGVLKPGSRRRLEASIGRLRKGLSLDWR